MSLWSKTRGAGDGGIGIRSLLTRHSGRIATLTFDELDGPGGVTESEDRGVLEVFHAAWSCYDDFRSHSLRLTDGQRLDFKRCILLLRSDREMTLERRDHSPVPIRTSAAPGSG